MASTGEVWRLGRRPALDGLRGVAVLLVVARHVTGGSRYATGGSIGVSAFFTLSGFLITALLLAERDQTGRISLASFYERRVRRLLPGMLALVVIFGTLQVASGLGSAGDVVALLLYVGNWPAALHHGPALGFIGHTWSLAVEEQFYLIWPLVMIVALRLGSRRVLLRVAVAGALASTVTRVLLWHAGAGWERLYFGSDTRADGLLVGCALACFMHGRAVRRANVPGVASMVVVGFVLLGFVPEGGVFFAVVAPSVAALATAAVIYATCAARERAGWLESHLLTLVGRRSYGLYLWHVPIAFLLLVMVQPTVMPRPVAILLTLLLSAAVTELSWRFVEQPFQARRRSAHAEPVKRQHVRGGAASGRMKADAVRREERGYVDARAVGEG